MAVSMAEGENAPLLTRRSLLDAGRRLVFRPGFGPPGDVLVTIFLRGGMDGIYAVPPHGDPAYRKQRPKLAPADPGRNGGLVDLDGYFGLHPDLAPLAEPFRERHLAVVQACGTPDRTLSHFEAMQTMERGVSEGHSVATGWVARHLGSTEGDHAPPLRAVAIGEVLPKSLQGYDKAVALRSVEDVRLERPAAWSNGFDTMLKNFYAEVDDLVGVAGRSTLGLLAQLKKLVASGYRPQGGVAYPDSNLGRALRQVAQLIKADIGLEVAALDHGDWDSHVGQVAHLARPMKQLGEALRAFHADLSDRMGRLTLIVMSEFGRRVRENSGLGTDHGRATAMFVLGGGILGGKVHGEWPGLGPNQLDRDGNLRVTTDYRDVLADLVKRRLRNPNLQQVFPDYSPRPCSIATG
jgi:uncharacterized protein (DUF1501 family)